MNYVTSHSGIPRAVSRTAKLLRYAPGEVSLVPLVSVAGGGFFSRAPRVAPVQPANSLNTARSRPGTPPDALQGLSAGLVWSRSGRGKFKH